MRRVLGAPVAGLVMVMALTGACSRGEGGKASLPVPPPRAENPSPVFGLPLPEGGVPAPDLAVGGVEAFRVPSDKASFADIDAFYTKELDARDFRGFAWCGRVADSAGVNIVRVWWHPAAPGSLTLQLHYDPAEGTQVLTSETSDAMGTGCPPPPIDG